MRHALPLLLTLPLPAFAADAIPPGTGLLPPTPEEIAWDREHIERVDRVVPNRTARERLAAERGPDGAMRPAAAMAVPDGGSAGALPRRVDNSAEKWFPPVRSQGGLSSCVAFSQTYYLATYMLNRALDRDGRDPADNTTKLSPRFVYSVSGGGIDNGAGLTSGFSNLARYGAPTWAEVPYNGSYKDLPADPAVWRSALRHRIGQVFELSEPTRTWEGQRSVRQLLANGFIASYGTFVNGWVFSTLGNRPDTAADDGIAGEKAAVELSRPTGAHAMVVVGYDDDAWCDLDQDGTVDVEELGAFKVVNSWGTGWGTRGFCWVPYQTAPQVILFNMRWATMRADAEPIVAAEVAVRTADRGGLRQTVNVGSPGDEVMPPQPIVAESGATYQPRPFFIIPGTLSYAGTSASTGAGVAFDLSFLSDGGTVRRWFLQADRQTASSQRIEGFRLTDGTGAVLGAATGTAPAGGLPRTLDAATPRVTAWVDWRNADTIPPAPVGDAAITACATTALTVTFTATGDDGRRGYAALHEIRWSTAPLHAGNLGAAPAATLPGDLRGAGYAFTREIAGLAPGTAYHLAIRGRDDAGRWSDPVLLSATTPRVLEILTDALPAAAVAAPYRCVLAGAGGTGARTWSLVPGWTETVRTGDAPQGGSPLHPRFTFAHVPGGFPLATRTGIQPVSLIQIPRDGSYATPSITLCAADGDRARWIVAYGRPLQMDRTGEGIFTLASTAGFAVRWKGRAYGTAAYDRPVEVGALLGADGTVTLSYGAIDDAFLDPDQRADIAVDGEASALARSAAITAGTVAVWRPRRLPAGLALDPASGELTGTPQEAATVTLPIAVSDRGSPIQVAERTFVLDIRAGSANAAPVITTPAVPGSATLVLP